MAQDETVKGPREGAAVATAVASGAPVTEPGTASDAPVPVPVPAAVPAPAAAIEREDGAEPGAEDAVVPAPQADPGADPVAGIPSGGREDTSAEAAPASVAGGDAAAVPDLPVALGVAAPVAVVAASVEPADLPAVGAPVPVRPVTGSATPPPEPEPLAESELLPEPEPEAARAAEPAAIRVPPVEPRPASVGGRQRLRAAMWPPRLSRGQLVVALLLFSLGLALAIQVRSTNDHDQLRGARQEDLVRILDELDSRQQRLQQEKAQLEQSMAQLENSSNQAKEAQEQTRKKSTELGVLAGTVKATGPGIVLTVDDPQGQVKADMLLDTLQELRAAGAEAIQINDVRVVVNTYFTDASGGGVQIDGKKVSQPYRFTVVGNPQDLTPALNIPGGVVRTLESHQARATIVEQQKIVVDALAEPRTPQYAKPAAK